MDKLYGLIQDINPKEICNHIENGNLAEWCNAWRIAAKEALQPKTNADRIRAMSDEELANFMAERSVNESTLHRLDKDHGLTSVQIEAIKHNVYCAFMQWLKQPAEE